MRREIRQKPCYLGRIAGYPSTRANSRRVQAISSAAVIRISAPTAWCALFGWLRSRP